jgi:apolipoprotein N-acyltransferase
MVGANGGTIGVVTGQLIATSQTREQSAPPPLSFPALILAIVVAGAGYAICFGTRFGAPAIFPALCALCLLSRARTSRISFYLGVFAGLAIYVPSLMFFARIFGLSAVHLWFLVSLPIGIFALLLRLARQQFGPIWALCLTPVLWTALEYFRSEIWYLRFAWLLPGQAVAFLPGIRLLALGVYGLGFVYVLLAAMAVGPSVRIRAIGILGILVATLLMYLPALPPTPDGGALHVAGVQLEDAEPRFVAEVLDRLAVAHPEAQILVLSEYTFPGLVPPQVRNVLLKHNRYLIAGGCHYVDGEKYFDTAFVVGPDGNDIFEQAKSVPIQFMNDGLPAPQRKVWNSPWGKIGIAVCYDLSYARVMDDFVRQGAQGLIIPTMDLQSWGKFERAMLHGRLAPVRSGEYGIPVFGVWSSGISQLTDQYGRVIATADYPGQGEMIAGPFDLRQPGHVPPDRVLAMVSMVVTSLFVAWLAIERVWRRITSS